MVIENLKAKFVVSVFLDIIDFFISPIPILGIIFDIFLTAVGLILWGEIGLINLIEVIPIPIDGFIPTLTITGIITVIKGGKKNDI